MIGSRLSAQADRAAARYRALLQGFEGVFQRNLNIEPGSPRTIQRAVREAYSIADTFLAEEGEHIQSILSSVRDDAYESTLEPLGVIGEETSSEVVKHVDGLAETLDAALRVQLERDVGALRSALRGVSLRAGVMAAGRGIPRSSALQIARMDASARFVFQDRAGRNWSSSKFIRTVWRQTLVLGWNETALLALAAHGQEIASINHPDQDHEWNEELISLTEEGTLPTWQDVKDDVFHPNTEAWISAAVSHH